MVWDRGCGEVSELLERILQKEKALKNEGKRKGHPMRALERISTTKV